MRRLVYVVAGLILLTGCGTDQAVQAEHLSEPSSLAPSSTSTPDDGADPAYQMPEVGQCRLLRAADIGPDTDSSPAVPCSSRHTAVTTAVEQLPTELSYTMPTSRWLPYVYKTCDAAKREALGGTKAQRALTLARYAWYEPTRAQRAAGATWFRCDLVMVYWTNSAAADEVLVPLPAQLPVIGSSIPDQYQMCMSRGKRLATVPCSEKHQFRSQVSLTIPTPGSYPSAGRQQALGKKYCEPRITTSYYGWTLPTRTDWRHNSSGLMVCFASTTQ